MPGLLSRGIFLSYRREDAGPYARMIQHEFRDRFPDARVFMDLDSIDPGADFAEVIGEALDSAAVLVALIGRQWATLADEEGTRRLHNPDDFVRFEVQTALERGVRVIPVLVDGARPLRRQELPAELQKLARLNALELSYGRYQYDADRLLDFIQEELAVVRRRDEAEREARDEAEWKARVRPENTTQPKSRPKDSAFQHRTWQLEPLSIKGARSTFRLSSGREAHEIVIKFGFPEEITVDGERVARQFAPITEELLRTLSMKLGTYVTIQMVRGTLKNAFRVKTLIIKIGDEVVTYDSGIR